MCCFTHQDLSLGPAPPDPRMRCRCGVGSVQCERQADGEDLLCGACRPSDLRGPVTAPGYRPYLEQELTGADRYWWRMTGKEAWVETQADLPPAG